MEDKGEASPYLEGPLRCLVNRSDTLTEIEPPLAVAPSETVDTSPPTRYPICPPPFH